MVGMTLGVLDLTAKSLPDRQSVNPCGTGFNASGGVLMSIFNILGSGRWRECKLRASYRKSSGKLRQFHEFINCDDASFLR